MTAEAIAKRLSDKTHREGKGWRTECPVHHGFSLSVRDGKAGLLVYCYAGCAGADILRELRQLNLSGDDRIPAGERDPDTSKADRGRVLAQRLWDKSAPLAPRNLVTSYLQSRAITLPAPPSLRYSPLCPHPDKIRRLPAMVAKIVNVDDGLIGVHRTYLRDDGLGKADNQTQKASLGSCTGGAIRLGAVRPANWLIIAEGIETTLSAMQIYNCAGWSAISVSGLDALILPPEAQKILVCADRDKNGIGEKRARQAAIRWVREGRQVRLTLPPESFKDFNDALIGGYYD